MASNNPLNREASAPTTVFEKLTLTERPSSTPASKLHSDYASNRMHLMTPPDSTRTGTGPMIVDGPTAKSDTENERVVISSQVEDDVFTTQALSTQQESCQMATTSSPTTKPAPRPDRLAAPITAFNAQGVLPPEACIFVANLSIARSDEQLEEACHNAFDRFGDCVVKVRRDKHKHPFALVQFHNIDDANQAIEGGSELIVDGRKIRTEHAQARRSVVLSRFFGGPISQEEARDLLEGYGPISHMQPTTHQDARLYGLPEGIWVQFAYYLDYKDALKGFNNSTNHYKISDAPALEPRVRSMQGGPQIVQGLRTPRSTTDQKSIFLGNLPHNVQEDDIHGIFQPFGEIKGVNVIRKPIQGGSGYNIFGFVEFASMQQAEAAAQAEIDVYGQRIRVEPKEYSARRHSRLQTFPVHSHPTHPGNARGFEWHHSQNQYQPASGYFVPTPQQYYFGHPVVPYQQRGFGFHTPHNYGRRHHQHHHVHYDHNPRHTSGQQWPAHSIPTYGGVHPIHDPDTGQRSYSH